MGKRNWYDIDDLMEPVAGIMETSQFFEKQQEREDKNIEAVEEFFKHISEVLRSKDPPSQESRLMDITIFRKCTQSISLAPDIEYQTLQVLMRIFFKVYLMNKWNPYLLLKILLHYFEQWNHCYRLVCASDRRIAQALQLSGAAANHKAIAQLMSIFNKDLWAFARETDRMLKENKPLLNLRKKGNQPFEV